MRILRAFLKQNKQLILFHLALNILVLFLITLASYINIPLNGFKSYLYYFIHLVLLQFTVFGFLYLLAINKWVFNILFPLFFLVCSIVAFWVYTLDISITIALFQAVFELRDGILLDTLSLPFLAYILCLLLGLYFVLKTRKQLRNHFNIPFLVVALLGISAFFIVEMKRNNTLKSRLPYNIIVTAKTYFQKEKTTFKVVDTTAISERNKLTIVFVLGESVRADHLQLNGYYKNTTPLLSRRKRVISFAKVHTTLTNTSASVPQILTDRSINDSLGSHFYTIYDVLNQLKYDTHWIGNQNPEKSYASIVAKNKSVFLVDEFRTIFNFKNKAFDSILLHPFNSVLKKKEPQFITLHTTGSHWYYENRYTDDFRVFTPVIKSKFIPSNTKEEMINSYDNTILYLDNFLNEVILKLEKSSKKSILIYLSDHGEILGENGKWLHAQQGKPSMNPAMLVWYSDVFLKEYANVIKALNHHKNQEITSDFLYHSVLDLIKTQNLEYDAAQSIFSIE